MLALDVLTALAIPPNYHRCHLDWNAHSTTLHKSVDHHDVFFHIIDAAKDIRKDSYFPIEELVNRTSDLGTGIVSLDMNINPSEISEKSKQSVPAGDSLYFRVDTALKDVVDITRDIRTMREIVNDPLLTIPKAQRLLFVWRARLTHYRIQESTIWLSFKACYQAITILLSTYQNIYVLITYFQDKHEFLKDFVYLLRTGPGSENYYPQAIPFQLRLLASYSLQATFGSEEGFESGIFGKFVQLQYSLGLSRGQYMGLIPCLLRSCAAYLVALVNQNTSTIDTVPTTMKNEIMTSVALVKSKTPISNPMKEIVEPKTQDHIEQLLWIESIFLFTLAILQFQETGQYLPENGLLSSLLAILKIKPFKHRSRIWTFVDSVVVMVADTCLGMGQVCASFVRQDGLEVTMEKIKAELDFLTMNSLTVSSSPSSSSSSKVKVSVLTSLSPPSPRSRRSYSIDVSAENNLIDFSSLTNLEIEREVGPSRIILQHLMSLLNMVLERGLQDAHEHRVTQLFKSPGFALSLSKIYRNMDIFTTRLGAMVDALVSDMINLDPNTPAMLIHLCQSGIIRLLLESFVKSDADSSYSEKYRSYFTEAFIIDRANLFFSISLTNQGIELLKEINPFPKLLSFFHEEQYLFPFSRLQSAENCRTIGGSLEEIVRHYPTLMDIVLESLFDVIDKIMSKIIQNGDEVMTDRYLSYLHAITSILISLNCMLTREQTINAFLNRNGIKTLSAILRIALGPNRYFLVNMACAVNTTAHFIGNTNAIAALTACLTSISSTKANDFIDNVILCLEEELSKMTTHLQQYWQYVGNDEGSQLDQTIETDWRRSNVPLINIIDTVTQLPLQSVNVYENGDISRGLTKKLSMFAEAAKSIVCVSYILNILYPPSSTVNPLFTDTNSSENKLKMDKLYEITYFLTNKVFTTAQEEIARHTQSSMYLAKHFQEKSIKKPHPIYKLIVANESGVWVREKEDDNSKKLYELSKGSIILATERKQINGKMLKYHIEDGWINCFKKSSQEPNVEVIDVMSKSIEELEQEMYQDAQSHATNNIFSSINPSHQSEISTQSLLESFIESSNEFRSISDISVSRAGYMSLFHISYSIRVMLEGIAKSIASSVSSSTSTLSSKAINAPSKFHIRRNVDLISHAMRDLTNKLCSLSRSLSIPSSEDSTKSNQSIPSTNNNEDVMDTTQSVSSNTATSKKVLFSLRLGKQNTQPNINRFVPIVESNENEIDFTSVQNNPHYMTFSCPISLNDCNISFIYLTLTIIELCNDLLISVKSGQEINVLLLLEFFYQNHVLEYLLQASVIVFMCSYDPFGSDKSINASSLGYESYSRTYPQISENHYLSIIHDRRKFSLESANMLIEFWNKLFQFLCHSTTTIERNLMKSSNNITAPFDAYILRRSLALELIKFIVPNTIMQPELLQTLPVSIVRQFMDMILVSMKAIQEVKTLALSFTKSWSLRDTSSKFGTNLTTSSMTISEIGAQIPGRLLRRNGFDSTRPTRPSTINRRMSRSFTPDPTSIEVLQDMGFHRNAILRAMHHLRSDSIHLLSFHMAETHYDDTPLSESMLSDLNMATESTQTAPTTTTEPTTSPTTNMSPIFEITSNNYMEFMNLSSSNLFSEPTDSSTRESSNTDVIPNPRSDVSNYAGSNTSDYPATDINSNVSNSLLPSIREKSRSENEKDKKTISLFADNFFEIIIYCCLKFIENGFQNERALSIVTTDIYDENKLCTRDMNIVIMLNYLLTSFDRKQIWSNKTLIKITILDWLYRRAMRIMRDILSLNETDDMANINSYDQLFGILHAINVLLYSPYSFTSSSSMLSSSGKTQVDQQAVLLLIFTRNPSYMQIYQLLLPVMENYCKVIKKTIETMMTFDNIPQLHAYLSPAMLLLDITAQSYLIDTEVVSESIHDLILESNRAIKGPLDADDNLVLSKKSTQSSINPFSEEFLTSISNQLGLTNMETTSSYNLHDDTYSFMKSFHSISSLRKTNLRVPREFSRNMADDDASNKRDSDEMKEEIDKEQEEAVETSKRPILPLLESIESFDTWKRVIDISLYLLKHHRLLVENESRTIYSSEVKSDDKNKTNPLIVSKVNTGKSIALHQAIYQILIHISSQNEVREYMIQEKLSSTLLQSTSMFPGLDTMIFTLIQRQFESNDILFHIMTNDMKSSMMKLIKKKPSITSSNMLIMTQFMDLMIPLLYRNQSMFLAIMKHYIITKTDSGNMFVEWNHKAPFLHKYDQTLFESKNLEVATPSREDGAMTTSSSSSVPSAKSDQKRKSNMISTSTSPTRDRKQLVNKTIASDEDESTAKRQRVNEEGVSSKVIPNNAVNPSTTSNTSQSHHMQSIIEDIMGRIIHLWVQVINKTINYPIGLSISDLLNILAELVTTIPGVATCIHKYQITDNGFVSLQFNRSFCNAITNQSFDSTQRSFISFLIHELLLQDLYEEQQKNNNDSNETDKSSLSHQLHQLCGTSVKDCASYLIGALVSRPGEGRKRTIYELIDSMRIKPSNPSSMSSSSSTSSMASPAYQISSSKQLKAVLILIEMIGCLLYTPSRWETREILAIPSVDVIYLMERQDFHAIVANLLCAISLDQPKALETSLKLSTILDIFLRKGIELVSRVNSSQQQTTSKTGVNSSNDSITPSRSDTNHIPYSTESNIEINDEPNQSDNHGSLLSNFMEDITANTNITSNDNVNLSQDVDQGREHEWNDDDSSDGSDSDDDEESNNSHDSDDDDSEGEEVYDTMYPSRSHQLRHTPSDDDDDDSQDSDHDEDNEEEEEDDEQDEIVRDEIFADPEVTIHDGNHDEDHSMTESDEEDEDTHHDDHDEDQPGHMNEEEDHEEDDSDDMDEDEDESDDDGDDSEDDDDGIDEEEAAYERFLSESADGNGVDMERQVELLLNEANHNAMDVEDEKVDDNDGNNDANTDPTEANIFGDDNSEDDDDDGEENDPDTADGSPLHLPDGIDVVFEDQGWNGFQYQTGDDDAVSNDESRNESNDSGDDIVNGNDVIPSNRANARSRSNLPLIGRMELNVQNAAGGDNFRFQVNFDRNTSDPMDIFQQVLGRTMRIRSTSYGTPSRAHGSNGGPGSGSRRRSASTGSARRQNRDGNLSGTANGGDIFRRNFVYDSDEEDFDGRGRQASRQYRSGISGSAILITDGIIREVDSAGPPTIGDTIRSEIADIVRRPPRIRTTNDYSSVRSSYMSSLMDMPNNNGLAGSSNRSLLYDNNAYHYLPQEMSHRPVINPLLAAIDNLRNTRTSNRVQSRSSGRSGISYSSSYSPGLITPSLQSNISSQSLSVNMVSNFFTFNQINSTESNTSNRVVDYGYDGIVNTNIRCYTRIPKFQKSNFRRTLGPSVSDRRWGIDVGLVQCVGENMNILTQKVQTYLSGNNNDDSNKKKVLKAARPSTKKSIFNGDTKNQFSFVSWDDMFGTDDYATSGTRSSNPTAEELLRRSDRLFSESKEEGELQEFKEMETDSPVESPTVTLSYPIQFFEVANVLATSVTPADSSTTMTEEAAAADSNVNETLESSNNITESSLPMEESTITANHSSSDVLTMLEGTSASTETVTTTRSGTTSSNRPPDIDPSVWDALPLDVQIEMAGNYGINTSSLIESEIAVSAVDREAFMALPAELRTEVLLEESTVRKRRMSFDQTLDSTNGTVSSTASSSSCNPGNAMTSTNNISETNRSDNIPTATATDSSSSNPATARPDILEALLGTDNSNIMDVASSDALALNIVTSSVTSSTSGSSTLSQENIDFVNSLSYDLRQEVLLSAEEHFLVSLTTAMREEARGIRRMMGLPMIDSESTANTAASVTTSTTRDQNTASNSISRSIERYIETAFSSAISGTTSTSVSSNRREPTQHRAADEAETTIVIEADRSMPVSFILPSYSFTDEALKVSYRIMKWILCMSGKNKNPRQFLRLLSTLCSYTDIRRAIVKILFAGVNGNPIKMLEAINHINTNFTSPDMDYIRQCGQVLAHPFTFKRILNAISHISRKPGRTVWRDIMTRQANEIWLFGTILSLLRLSSRSHDTNQMIMGEESNIMILGTALDSPVMSGNLDTVLHLLEEFVAPLSRISVAQANKLVYLQQISYDSSSYNTKRDDPSSSTSTKPAEVDVQPTKRVRIREPEREVDTGEPSDPNNSQAKSSAMHKDESTSSNALDASRSNSLKKISLPFPSLETNECLTLAMFVSSDYAFGLHRKRILKVLRVLALYDGNWNGLLLQFCAAATTLAGDVSKELDNLLVILRALSQSQSQSQFKQIFHTDDQSFQNYQQGQQKLLNTLETMTILRSRSNAAASDESEIVSENIRNIFFGNCWTMLFECLDHVRDLEGLAYETSDDNEEPTAPPAPPTPSQHGRNRHNRQSIGGHASHSRQSASSSTPRASSHISSSNHEATRPSHTTNGSASQRPDDNRPLSSLSSLTMRFIPLIECFMLVCGATVIKKGQSNLTTNSENLPGHRFRQHASYADMQVELNPEDSFSKQLITFVDKNRLLLNIVLKSNIQLLELSFSPLIYIPRCRHLLHFDVKRSYFRTKLRKLRHQAQRVNGSMMSNGHLHIKVRRGEVFVDSFRSLRYKSAEEMKRKLAVEFSNEEGMDAGGLTREVRYTICCKLVDISASKTVSTSCG